MVMLPFETSREREEAAEFVVALRNAIGSAFVATVENGLLKIKFN